jgi:hypothetical protein
VLREVYKERTRMEAGVDRHRFGRAQGKRKDE